MKKVLFVLFVLSVLFSPFVWANNNDEEAPLGKIQLPEFLKWTKAHPGISGINLLINNLIKMIFILASTGLFFMFLYGGLRYITSQGDKVQVEAARNIIMYALIGFAIVALSFAIMRVIETFFGISILVGPSAGVPSGCIKIDCTKCGGHNIPPNCQVINGVDYCCP